MDTNFSARTAIKAVSETVAPVRIRPILFSSVMVRANLEGRKSQTRRVVKPTAGLDFLGAAGDDRNDPSNWGWGGDDGNFCLLTAPAGSVVFGADYVARCPYGQPGDLLMVREAYSPCVCKACEEAWPKQPDPALIQLAPHGVSYRATYAGPSGIVWRPSIHMPRWACRLVLRVTGVRVERVESIGESDALAEGFVPTDLPGSMARSVFLNTFYNINNRAPVGSNPWVWVVSYEVAAKTHAEAQAILKESP